MTIVYRLDEQGGFTCGDTVTRMTAYAYPTSTHAVAAKRKPAAVAVEMLDHEIRLGMPHEADSDARHWRKLTPQGAMASA